MSLTRRSFLPALLLAATGAFVLAAVALPDPATAQLALDRRHSDKPIEIYANQGIEWGRDQRTAIARGDARAVQGDVSVRGDTLTVHYRESKTGGNEIWRVEALGGVRIVSPEQTATGNYGVYEIDRGLLVLTGSPRLKTRTDEVTARDQLEFWENQNAAVARGDAMVVSNQRRIRADTLTAFFKGGSGNTREVERVEAHGNVLVSTASEVVRGDRGVYQTESGIAVLLGSVKMTRGGSQLNGAYAEVNLKTGISRLMAAAPDRGGDGRVRGLIVPGETGPVRDTGRVPNAGQGR
jgi:lipopolysaccharide export system protein LptA